eukprot:2751053-Rhodomonas_salina.1
MWRCARRTASGTPATALRQCSRWPAPPPPLLSAAARCESRRWKRGGRERRGGGGEARGRGSGRRGQPGPVGRGSECCGGEEREWECWVGLGGAPCWLERGQRVTKGCVCCVRAVGRVHRWRDLPAAEHAVRILHRAPGSAAAHAARPRRLQGQERPDLGL